MAEPPSRNLYPAHPRRAGRRWSAAPADADKTAQLPEELDARRFICSDLLGCTTTGADRAGLAGISRSSPTRVALCPSQPGLDPRSTVVGMCSTASPSRCRSLLAWRFCTLHRALTIVSSPTDHIPAAASRLYLSGGVSVAGSVAFRTAQMSTRWVSWGVSIRPSACAAARSLTWTRTR